MRNACIASPGGTVGHRGVGFLKSRLRAVRVGVGPGWHRQQWFWFFEEQHWAHRSCPQAPSYGPQSAKRAHEMSDPSSPAPARPQPQGRLICGSAKAEMPRRYCHSPAERHADHLRRHCCCAVTRQTTRDKERQGGVRIPQPHTQTARHSGAAPKTTTSFRR